MIYHECGVKQHSYLIIQFLVVKWISYFNSSRNILAIKLLSNNFLLYSWEKDEGFAFPYVFHFFFFLVIIFFHSNLSIGRWRSVMGIGLYRHTRQEWTGLKSVSPPQSDPMNQSKMTRKSILEHSGFGMLWNCAKWWKCGRTREVVAIWALESWYVFTSYKWWNTHICVSPGFCDGKLRANFETYVIRYALTFSCQLSSTCVLHSRLAWFAYFIQ